VKAEPLTDGELARLRELLRTAKAGMVEGARRAWVEQAQEGLERLLDTVQEAHDRMGGTFAVQLRRILERRIVREVAGRCELTDDTEEKSFSVHVTPEGVFVDVRMRIGRWQQ
jgi:hypothetical protein